jgi:hypothetical protein
MMLRIVLVDQRRMVNEESFSRNLRKKLMS